MLSYLLFIATIGGIYGLLALSLNLIWGGVGMVNLGLAGFFAVLAAAAAQMVPGLSVATMASFVGMGLVGVGGMLLGLDSSIDPLTGTRILLSLFAAAVLGGLGSAPGAVLGAFLIGMAEELSVLVVGSQYRAAVGFIAILLVLTLRPRGLLGERAY